MRIPFLPRALLGFCLLAGLVLSCPTRAQFPGDELPLAQPADVQLFLELIVNRRITGQVIPVTRAGEAFILAGADLRKAGLEHPAFEAAQVNLDHVPGLTVSYLAANQLLLVDVPPHWLPGQEISYAKGAGFEAAQASLGAALNYDLYASRHDSGVLSRSLFHDMRVFGGFGSLRSSGSHRVDRFAQGERRGAYTRYDTTWLFTDQARLTRIEAGDVATNALPWSSVVRLGGVQVSRDFSLRPDIISYPLPELNGSAAVPSTVDVFINGYRAASTQVQPGPFTLSGMPFVNGAGEATIVTTDAAGRQVSTTAPLYVARQLLKPGLFEYSLAAGALRERYGVENFAYGGPAGSGSLRYGVNEALTLEAHMEAADALTLGGMGALFQLRNAGLLNLAASAQAGSGNLQRTIGYQYFNQRFSVSVEHTARSAGYRDLATLRHAPAARRSSQVFAGLRLGMHGSLGASYLDSQTAAAERVRLLGLTWGRSLRSSSVFASAQRELGAGWSFSLQFSRRFGARSTANSQLGRDPGQGMNRALSWQQSVPTQGGIGFNAYYKSFAGQGGYSQGDLTWKNRIATLQGGYFGNAGDAVSWAQARGTVIWMDGQVLPSSSYSDSFVLVSTGRPNVAVAYENQAVGRTNGAGYLLVPHGTSNYAANYSIDVLGLPANVSIPVAEQKVAVRPGAGYLLQFPVLASLMAYIELVDSRGAPLPLGSLVTLDDGSRSFVGWDGMVYFEGLRERGNVLTVTLAQQPACTVNFDMDPAATTIATLGPLTCE